MSWYLSVLKKYAVFTGRAQRKEYWIFFLINMIIALVAGIIDASIGGTDNNIISVIYSLAILLPSLAVSVRRLHDTDRSGWWMLLSLIPLIGPIILIIFFVQNGTADINRYGENPKEINV
ncbi:DUF805 domain-containing protein [Plesiomonas shigelloides]|uniref:DUF805 domain-containing protein n=1 Tax=Plesiomonas shigelloides TaxID=703 RepID=UPI000A0F545C|nr:DUF805 domain-containing protein [Plesiomonas shigelloides]